MNMNNVSVKNTGFYRVTFKDGQELKFNWPDVKITGLMSKDPHYIFVDKIQVTDEKNKLTGLAKFIETKSKGWFSKKKETEVPNTVRMKISQKKSESEEVDLVKGKYVGRWTLGNRKSKLHEVGPLGHEAVLETH